MKNHSFDDLVKQKALHHEAPVPAGTWEAIAPKKKKRRFIIFWWMTGVALLSGFILWQSYRKDNGHQAGINHENTRKAVAVTKNETLKKDDTDGSVRDSDIEKGSGYEKEQNTISLALPGWANQDERSSSASVLPAKRTATFSGKPGSRKRLKKENSSDERLEEMEQLSLKDESSQSNFKIHNEIGLLESRKEILSGPSGISNLIANKVDSINAITSVMAINAKKRIRRNKWAVEASIMPFLPLQQDQSLLYMTRTNKGDMHEYDFKTDNIHTQLQPSLAYTVAVYKKINPRLRIGTGIQYAMVKEKVDLVGKETRTNYTEVQRLENGGSGPRLVTDTVVTTTTGILTIDALNSYKFISIPLSIQYTLMQRRAWALQVNGGLLLNVSATYHNSIEGDLIRFDNNGIHTSKQRNNMGVDLFAGLRVSRSYGAFRLFAEPVLRFNTRRYDLNGMINRKYLHQAGLSFGISYTPGY